MSRRKRRALGALGVCLVLALGFLWSVLARTAKVQEAPPTPFVLFSAPSQFPEGEEAWVLIGADEELPQDATCLSETVSLVVAEVQRLSSRALSARVQFAGPGPHPIKVRSGLAGREGEVWLSAGPHLPTLCVDDNISAEERAAGEVAIYSQYLTYGFLPQEGVTLGAVRLHNRTTGKWYRREYLAEKFRREAEPPAEVGENFQPADPLLELPDTDGNGIPDFNEPPEEKPQAPDFVGVRLEPGVNPIDIVAVDEQGFASWDLLEVLAVYTPDEEAR